MTANRYVVDLLAVEEVFAANSHPPLRIAAGG
jgi:hypothetical protein